MFQINDTKINNETYLGTNKYKIFITYLVVIQTVFLVFETIPGIDIVLNIFPLPLLLFIWFILSLMGSNIIVKPWMIVGILWLLYMAIIGYGLDDFASRSRLITDGSLFFFMIIIDNFLKDKKFMQLSKIGNFSVLGIVLTIVYSYFMLLKFPMLARDTASGQAGIFAVGIAGYDYIYGLVTLIPMVILKMIECFKNNDRKSSLIFMILFISSILYIIKSQFTIAFLLLLLGIILGIISLKKQSIVYKFVYTFLIILWIAIIINILEILKWIANELSSSVVQSRLVEIINVIVTKDFMASDRLFRMSSTLDAFYQYPFGAVFYGARFMSDTLGVDFHTEWLNLLAYYGWQGLLLFIVWLGLYMKEVIKNIKKYMPPIYIYSQFIMIFITGLLNPIHYAAGYYFISFFLSTSLIFIGYHNIKNRQPT